MDRTCRVIRYAPITFSLPRRPNKGRLTLIRCRRCAATKRCGHFPNRHPATYHNHQRLRTTQYNLVVVRTRDARKTASTTCGAAPEQGMVAKAYMNDNQRSRRQPSARSWPGRRIVRRRFSVCLFIVVLAVFSWVMHRRLAQYDSAPQAIHQSTAIKVCLTKRNPISVPSMQGIDVFAAFFLAFAVMAMLGSPGDSDASLALRAQRNRWNRRSPSRTRPCLVHFFFFPPPSLLPVL